MHSRFIKRFLLLLMALMMSAAALCENYEANAMRLLRYEGDVQIEDASGQARFVMANVRFNSGETMKTGVGASASVSLDSAKIVTLDAESSVQFVKEGGHMELNLTSGTLFLDVSEKLDENETLDIKTSTMSVGIRGTVVFLSVVPEDQARRLTGDGGSSRVSPAGDGRNVTVFGVLEGSATLNYDEGGSKRALTVSAGQKAILPEGSSRAGGEAELAALTREDLSAFVQEQMTSEAVRPRVEEACPQLFEGEDYPADGNWEFTGRVTIVAQSASKLYDGTPLTRTGDILVYGLPEQFGISAYAGGSRTDAGVSTNPVAGYTITNRRGEDVTRHFASVETVSGQLVVDPAPMSIWTGSASKCYDGTPLTCEEAGFDLISGQRREDPWQNTSLVLSEAEGETLYGLSGTILVHGTNPLTEETREDVLPVGYKLTVHLSDGGAQDSISFEIKKIGEDELPEEVLRLYADNPELLSEACKDAGWDEETLKKRIAALPETAERTTQKDGLTVSVSVAGGLRRQLTNARINIDSEITDYNGRALNGGEAHFAEIRIDDSVTVTATGSQTEVGESVNTYEIDWGSENKNNFVVSEDLGTLKVLPSLSGVTITAGSFVKTYDGKALSMKESVITGVPEGYSVEATVTGSLTNAGVQKTVVESYRVLDPDGADVTQYYPDLKLVEGTITIEPAPLTVSTGSGEKVYDGEALTNGEAALAGLVNGETALVVAVGSITDAGSADNGYEISWGSAKAANYELAEELGTLSVEPLQIGVDMGGSAAGYSGGLYVPNASVTYLNGAHAGETVSGTRLRAAGMLFRYALFTGDSIDLSVDGSGIDAGSYNITTGLSFSGSASNYALPSASSLDFTLTIEPATLSVSTGSASKPYDATPLTNSEVMVTGLQGGDSIAVIATGEITEVGETDNTYSLDWGSVNSNNYVLTESLGTLAVTRNYTAITITAGSSEAVYTPYALTNSSYTVEGTLPESLSLQVTVEGSQLVAGSSDNVITGYQILNPDGADRTDAFANVTLVNGTLTVTKAKINVWSHPSDSSVFETTATYTYRGSSYPFTCAWQGAYNADQPASSVIISEMYGGGWTEKDVGTYTLSFSAQLRDDLNDKYELGELRFGSISITPAALTVTTESASKPYNAEALTAGASLEGLCGVDALSSNAAKVTATGSIVDAGTAENTYSIDWKNVDPNNYTLSESIGTLEVMPLNVQIVIEDSIYTFNNGYNFVGVSVVSSAECSGEMLGDTAYMVRVLDARFTGNFNQTAKRKNAGSDPISLTIDSWIQGNPANYSVSVKNGSLTVNPCPITVTTGSASKVYDGTPLTSSEATVSGLMCGEGITAVPNGSITDVGEAENTYTMNWNGWVESNYEITEEHLGTLTVLPLKLNVNLGGGEVYYDSEPHYIGPATMTYGNGTHAGGTVTLAGGAPGPQTTYSGTLFTGDSFSMAKTQTAITGASYETHGTYTAQATISFANGKDPNFTVSYTNATLTIKPVTLSIVVSGYTVSYDGSLHFPNVTVSYVNGPYAGQTLAMTDQWKTNSTTMRRLFDLKTGGNMSVNVTGVGPAKGTYTVTTSDYSVSGVQGDHAVTVTSGTITIN